MDDNTLKILIDNIAYSLTNKNDFNEIAKLMKNNLPIESLDDAKFQLKDANILFNKSIKCYDVNNKKIYGVLIYCNFNIDRGSPICSISPNIYDLLSNYKGINGFAFVVDKQLRGTNIHKNLINESIKFIKPYYDFIWCGVEQNLKSHNYWKRMGFYKLFSIKEASFYIYFFNKTLLNQYLLLINEKDK